MKRIIFIVIVTFPLIISCKENNIKYTYFNNGKVMEKIDFDNNKIHSYYKNGKLQYIAGINRDKLHGKYISYFESGTVKDSGYYNNDNQYGTWYYYNKKSLLDKVCNYVFVTGRGNLLNEIVYFNKNGDTIKDKGHHFKIETEKDTICLNDTFVFDIFIDISFFNDSCGAVIGDFDSIYNINDSSTLVNFKGYNNKIKCKYNKNKLGKNVLRGAILDYTVRSDSDYYRELFFSKEYFVKPCF